MTTPREEQPATEAAATPTVSTAPPRSRWRFGNVPSHVGPARTSTVVIAALFLVLFGLHSYLQATADAGYTTVTTDTGQRVRVPNSQLATVAPQAPSTAPATTAAPRTTTPTAGTTAPRTSAPGTPATTTPTDSGPAAPRSTTTPPSRSTTVVPTPSIPTDTGAPTS